MRQKKLSVHPRSNGPHTIPKFTLGSFRVQFGNHFGAGIVSGPEQIEFPIGLAYDIHHRRFG